MRKRVHSLNERQEQEEDITLCERTATMSPARRVFDKDNATRTDVSPLAVAHFELHVLVGDRELTARSVVPARLPRRLFRVTKQDQR